MAHMQQDSSWLGSVSCFKLVRGDGMKGLSGVGVSVSSDGEKKDGKESISTGAVATSPLKNSIYESFLKLLEYRKICFNSKIFAQKNCPLLIHTAIKSYRESLHASMEIADSTEEGACGSTLACYSLLTVNTSSLGLLLLFPLLQRECARDSEMKTHLVLVLVSYLSKFAPLTLVVIPKTF